MHQLSRPTGLVSRSSMPPAANVVRSSHTGGPRLISGRASPATFSSSFVAWTCSRHLDRHGGAHCKPAAPLNAVLHSNVASNGTTAPATLPSPLPNIPPSDPSAMNNDGHDHSSSGDSNGKSSKEALYDKFDALAGKYGQADERLDSLERTLAEVMKEIKHRRSRSTAKKQQKQQDQQKEQDRQGHQAPSTPRSTSHHGTAAQQPATARVLRSQGLGSSSDGGEDDLTLSETDDDDDGGVLNFSKIQSNITETVNGGYLESMRNLRQTLMASEWDMQAKHWARRRGVSNFELHCATNGIDVDFGAISKLYEDPEGLDVLPDTKQRLLARSMILQAVDDRHKEVYKECTELAKELASQGLKDILPETPAGLTDLIKGFLPSLPFLKK